jgi:hypothetical protein
MDEMIISYRLDVDDVDGSPQGPGANDLHNGFIVRGVS